MTSQPNQPVTDPSGEPLDPDFLEHVLATVEAALPPAPSEAARSARHSAMRLAVLSLAPRTPMEAMLAAEAVVGHYVIMACYRIALAPDSDPAAATRARANAAALTRVRLAMLRALRRETRPSGAAADPPARRRNPMHREEPVQPVLPPLPPHEQFQPRDRFGAPIPLWRSQDMTMAQRRATYAATEPRDVRDKAVAEALADEAAMIAEEAAHQAAGAPTVPA